MRDGNVSFTLLICQEEEHLYEIIVVRIGSDRQVVVL